MKVALCYFSGTGNTKYVAEKIAEKLKTKNVECVVFNVENQTPDYESFDVVGLGYPVHAFNTPKFFFDKIKENPPENKKIFFFKTSGEPLSLNDASSQKLSKLLSSCEICGEFHFVMPYNIICRHNDAIVKQMLNSADTLAEQCAELIAQGEKKKLVFSSGNLVVSALFRIEWAGAKIIGKTFSVNGKCVSCKKCVENCPTKNISFVDGKPVFGKKCALCMRCSFLCPTNAIELGLLKKWKVNGVYDFEKIKKQDLPDFVTEKTKGIYTIYKKYFKKRGVSKTKRDKGEK